MQTWTVWLVASFGIALGCEGERSSVSTPERGGISDSGGSAGGSAASGQRPAAQWRCFKDPEKGEPPRRQGAKAPSSK